MCDFLNNSIWWTKGDCMYMIKWRSNFITTLKALHIIENIFLHFAEIHVINTSFNLSAEDFAKIQYKQDAFSGLQKEWPPYNGWGSEEDSLCSCMGLLPKPPRRDFIKVTHIQEV